MVGSGEIGKSAFFCHMASEVPEYLTPVLASVAQLARVSCAPKGFRFNSLSPPHPSFLSRINKKHPQMRIQKN